jgi:hypothetical protein
VVLEQFLHSVIAKLFQSVRLAAPEPTTKLETLEALPTSRLLVEVAA